MYWLEFERIFSKLDRNGDGVVSVEELNWLLQRIGVQHYTCRDLEALLQKPRLDFNDFLEFCLRSISQRQEDEEDLVKAFNVFDLNGDGFISCDELEIVLFRLGLWNGCDCRTMIRAYDADSDGLLDFQDFKNMMRMENSII